MVLRTYLRQLNRWCEKNPRVKLDIWKEELGGRVTWRQDSELMWLLEELWNWRLYRRSKYLLKRLYDNWRWRLLGRFRHLRLLRWRGLLPVSKLRINLHLHNLDRILVSLHLVMNDSFHLTVGYPKSLVLLFMNERAAFPCPTPS
jgi:hypothetical protein